jgi:hypothetical protein
MSTPFVIHPLKIKAGQKFFQTQNCLYSNQIEQLPLQKLGADRCAFVGTGDQRQPALYCRDHLMAVRFLPRRWSEAFQAHSISAATLTDLICTDLLELRHRKQRLTHSAGEAFRWVHGDADGLPGIVVDDYSSIVVLQSGSPLGDFLLEFVIAALLKTTEKPIFERSSGQIRALEKLPERTRWIREPTRDQTANIPDTVQTEIAGKPDFFSTKRKISNSLKSCPRVLGRNRCSICAVTSVLGRARARLPECTNLPLWIRTRMLLQPPA